ncbi:hypothetical protein F5Y17DRAFT_102136 [Xylariaceae sp. FL0594]|nr:hypothetical protein F5Y17DRAFT_102136 [Xylariaceae sp. FL0594]
MHFSLHDRQVPHGESHPDGKSNVVYEMIDAVNESHDRPPAKKESASWTLEVFGLVMSVLFIGAQVALLVWIQNKPYYETWKFPLSINAVLAILTTASKTSQLFPVGEAIGQVKWVDFKAAPQRLISWEMYDRTSRGPQGAAEFLLRMRASLATLGALVILLALALDPFTQQVVHLEAQNVTTPDDRAIIGFGRQYNTEPAQTGLSSLFKPEFSTRDGGMQGAILKGIFNIETIDEFQCNGACSWDGTFRSLGFSSTCKNITQAAEASKVCKLVKTPSNRNICNYTTPGGVSFSTMFVPTDSATSLVVAVNETFWKSYRKLPGPFMDPDFLKIAVFQSNSGVDNYFNGNEILAPNITECSLSLELHEYTGIRSNGSHLNLERTSRKLLPGFGNYTSLPGGTDRVVRFNQTEAGPLDPPLTINIYDWANMLLFFQSNAFSVNVNSGSVVSQTDIGNAAAFFNADVTSRINNMASSMSDYLRSLSKGPNVEKFHGNRVEVVVFVRVRWLWFILPVFETLAAIVFVLYVIVYSYRHDIPGWKSSALATLAHSVNHENHLVTTFSGPAEVKQRAREMDIQLY